MQAHFARKHSYPLGLQNLDQHVMSSLMKHAFTGDLLSLYTSGFLGPKRRHIWRVHNRLDALQPAALRNYTGSFSNGKPRALSGAPEPLTSQPRERDNGSTAADIRAADLRDLRPYTAQSGWLVVVRTVSYRTY